MPPPGLPASYTAERFSPAFLPNRESHVTVPLLRAIITGTFAGITVWGIITPLALMGKATFWSSMSLGGTVGLIVFFVGSAVYWFYITGQYDSLLSRVESVTGMDINQDGNVGPSKPEPRTVRVEVEQGKSRELQDLPGDENALIEFARGIVSGVTTFSYRGAEDSGYGRENFKSLRDIFILRHWADWNNPQNREQGVNLYRAGKTILARIAEMPTVRGSTAGMSNQMADRRTGDNTLT